jgi:phenylacetate-CoA ligase
LSFRAAPLLRYRLTDSVTTGPSECPCGHPGPTLARIEGRTIDYFELPGGRAVHPYRILGPLLSAAPWIRQYQLVQTAPDRIVLRHVPRSGADPASGGDLAKLVADELGPGVRFEVEEVSRIDAGRGLKSRPIVSLGEHRLART